MKILIILKRWVGGVGGGVKNIKKELNELGHEVDVIARDDDWQMFGFLGSFFKYRNKVNKIVKEKNYDIIYTQDWSMALPLLFPSRLFKEKHYCMIHGHQRKILQENLQIITSKIMGGHILVMAPSLKRKFPKANINYCGVNVERFFPLEKKEKRTYLGWTEKGTELISIKEMEEISRGLEMPLLIAKGIPYDEMNDFYNKCMVYISLPPANAGFQASWLEAMQAGVPIVVGNNNGAGEIQPFDKVPLGKEHDIDLIVNFIRNAKKTHCTNPRCLDFSVQEVFTAVKKILK